MKNALLCFSICKHLLLHHLFRYSPSSICDLHHIITLSKFNPDRRRLIAEHVAQYETKRHFVGL